MDEVIISHLNSGNACLLVGSGPSTACGYPSWRNLASRTVEELLAKEAPVGVAKAASAHLSARDYPSVFSAAEASLGRERLIAFLRSKLTRSAHGNNDLYDVLARLPVSTYLTTNYDDELLEALNRAQAIFKLYGNDEPHIRMLTSNVAGTIFKIHGDLIGGEGLVLTKDDYAKISGGPEWEYWRTAMTTMFQTRKVIIFGHSLTDPNIQHVLSAARRGAGIDNPICWLAPDATFEQRKQMLDQYRIRVISYPNSDGKHSALVKYAETLSSFVYPRASIRQSIEIQSALAVSTERDAAASGFFVFNRVQSAQSTISIQEEVLIAALKGLQSKLATLPSFTVKDALGKLTWGQRLLINDSTAGSLGDKMVAGGYWQKRAAHEFFASRSGTESVKKESLEFEHLEDRFLSSTVLRARKEFPSLAPQESKEIASHIKATLVSFFQTHGLTIATALLNNANGTSGAAFPASILPFINQASTSFAKEETRLAFIVTATKCFVEAGEIEREYLGRLAFGFIAFHALGVFGDVADERVKHVRTTIWLIDSNVQIEALSQYSPQSDLIRNTLRRLHSDGVRFFTTEKLALEAFNHLAFAQRVVSENGVNSPEMLAAATGQAPFLKSNQFLAGFALWSQSTARDDWDGYLEHLFGHSKPSSRHLVQKLDEIGIETVALDVWPGFKKEDYATIEELVSRIQALRPDDSTDAESSAIFSASYKKALPEAHALLVVKHERAKIYDILGLKDQDRTAFFISDTSLLNAVEIGVRVTWPSESFIRFAGTIAAPLKSGLAHETFESLLLSFALHGQCLVKIKDVRRVFDSIVDAAKLRVAEQRSLYTKHLAAKYGTDPDLIIRKLPLSAQPKAWAQLLGEMIASEKEGRATAEAKIAELHEQKSSLEKKLKLLERYETDAVSRRFKKIRRRNKNRGKGTKDK